MAEKQFKIVFNAKDKGLTRFLGNATRKVNKFSKSLKQAQKFAKMSNSRMAVLGRGMQKVGQNMQDIGSKITTRVTLPVAAGVGLAVKKFATFEEGLVGVGKTTNLAGKELQNFGKSIRDMSKVAPFATDDLLTIAQAAGQLGVSSPKNLLKFTDTISKLGKTTDLHGENAAMTLARILKVTGEDKGNVDKLGSALVQLGNNVEATEAQIASVAGEVARKSAPLFSLASKDVVALSATMASMGIQGEAGGTAVLDTFKMLSDNIRSGKGDIIKSLEVLTGKSRKLLKDEFAKDTFGVFVQFIQGLKFAKEQGAELDEVLDDLSLTNKRTVATVGSLVAGADSLGKNIEFSNEQYKNATALNKEYSLQLVTLNSRFGILRNKVMDLALSLGERLDPIIKNKVIPGIEGIIKWIDKHPRITKFALAFAGIVAVMGPFLFVLGSVIKSVGSLIIGFKVFQALAMFGVIPSFGLMALAAAKFIVVAGLVAGAAFLIWDNWDVIQPKLESFWDSQMAAIMGPLGLLKVMSDEPSRIKRQWEKDKKFFSTFWDSPKNSIKEYIQDSQFLVNIWEGFPVILDKIQSLLTGFSFDFEGGPKSFLPKTGSVATNPKLNSGLEFGKERQGQARAGDGILKTRQETIKIDKTNHAKITVDMKNVPVGTAVTTDKADGPLNLNVGFANT